MLRKTLIILMILVRMIRLTIHNLQFTIHGLTVAR